MKRLLLGVLGLAFTAALVFGTTDSVKKVEHGKTLQDKLAGDVITYEHGKTL